MYGVILDMNNKNILISTAMLSSIWEKERKDLLDLMAPFVLYIIGKTYCIKEQIDSGIILKQLNVEYGFKDVPNAVLDKILTRLTRRRKLHKAREDKKVKYILNSDLSGICQEIDNSKYRVSTETKKVIEALTEFLNKNQTNFLAKDYDLETVEAYFTAFLEERGYFVYERNGSVQPVSKEKSIVFYFIALFLNEEFEKKSDIIKYIQRIVQGLMIAKVIYFQPELHFNENLENVDFYLDTGLLLNIFGYKTLEQNKSGNLFASILKENNANLKSFNINYEEVYSIIDNYKNYRNYRNCMEDSNSHTLEYFDKHKTSSEEIGVHLETLLSTFKKNLIDVVDTPPYPEIDECDNVIDEAGLVTKMVEEINFKKRVAENDVAVVSAIMRLRNGARCKKMEHCKAIFVTTNERLTWFINKELEFPKFAETIPPIISDLDLTTILWLKNYKNHSNLPMLKLIENSYMSLIPSDSIREEFFKKVNQLIAENPDASERLAAARVVFYRAKEKIMYNVATRPDYIEKMGVEDVDEMMSSYYAKESEEQNTILEEKNSKQRASIKILETKNKELRQALVAKNKLEQENEEIRIKYEKLQRDISDREASQYEHQSEKIKKMEKKWKKILTAVTYSCLGVVYFIIAYCIISQFSELNTIVTMVLAGFGVLSLTQATYQWVGFFKKIINIGVNKIVHRK